ncbi:MFS transporter [Saccharopolyspora sp. ID03-671]|uniref:MFS transporter n=1 Tax=Saccharopolyspora sp. ID03-671 TaxID=3073066 RepID=UPI00325250DE
MSSAGTPARRPNQWRVGTVSGMASYIDGAALAAYATAIVLYQQPLGLTGTDIGVLSAILTLGVAIGAAVGGRLGDALGRRSVFLVTMVLIVLSSGALVFGTAFPLLVVATAALGFAVGADLPVSIATIAEAATEENRGKLVSFSQTLWFAGQLISILLSALVGGLGRFGGQILFAHVGIAALIILILRLSLPESQEWLAARDERRSGATTLRAQRVGIADVLKDRVLLVPFLALMVFYTAITVGGNTFGQFSSYIAINVAHTSVQALSTANLIVGLPLGLVCALVFMRVADTRFRMKAYLIGFVAWISAYSVPIAFGFSLPTLTITIAFGTIAGGLAGEAIMRVWSQETFPTLVRASVQGAVLAIARIASAGVALVAPQLLTAPRLFFLSLAATAAIGLVVGWIAFHKGRINAFKVEAQDVSVAEFDHERS